MVYQQFWTSPLDWGRFYVELDSDEQINIRLSFCMMRLLSLGGEDKVYSLIYSSVSEEKATCSAMHIAEAGVNNNRF